jgi:ferritin-like metal-binding protein YciE
MSTKDLKDLFIYESALAISTEKLGDGMLRGITYHVKDQGLAGLLRDEEKRRRECLAEFESCFYLIGGSALSIPTPGVEALRDRLQNYVVLRRAPEMVDLFVLGTALRFTHFMLAGYKELVDLSEYVGEDRCKQSFQNILRYKEEYAERFEQYSHRMVERAADDAGSVGRSGTAA